MTASRAARVALALALMAPVPGVAAPPTAARLGRDAAAAFKRGEYEVALEHLQKARALSPEPAQLFVMARCHEELGQLAAARGAYEAYLKEDVAAEDRALAERRLADVTRLIALSTATLVVTRTPPDATVVVNGVESRAAGPVRHEVKPGRYNVRIFAPGHQPWEQAVVLDGGTTRELTVALVPEAAEPATPATTASAATVSTTEPPPEPSRALEWSLLGVGAASLATAAVLTALSLDAHDEAEGGGLSQVEARDASDRGNTLGAAAWGTWALGAGLATTGAVLLLLPGDEAPATPSLAPVPGGAVVGLGGSF